MIVKIFPILLTKRPRALPYITVAYFSVSECQSSKGIFSDKKGTTGSTSTTSIYILFGLYLVPGAPSTTKPLSLLEPSLLSIKYV